MSEKNGVTQNPIHLNDQGSGSQGENPKNPPEGQPSMEIPTRLPLLAVRDIVVFNYMIIPLFVGREKSIKAIESAINENQRYIFIATQKDEKVEDPKIEDVYEIGTIAIIMRMLKMPDGKLKILVQGLSRAKIKQSVQESPFHMVEVEVIQEQPVTDYSAQVEAQMRTAREQSEKIISYGEWIPQK